MEETEKTICAECGRDIFVDPDGEMPTKCPNCGALTVWGDKDDAETSDLGW